MNQLKNFLCSSKVKFAGGVKKLVGEVAPARGLGHHYSIDKILNVLNFDDC